MKKKNGSIALLFQRHEAKAKKIASPSPPILASVDVGSGIGSNQTPFVYDGSGSGSNPIVDVSSTENDESIEVEEELEPVDEGLPEEAEPRVHDAGSLPLEHDPGLRQLISSFDVNERDAARRGYILKGTCQPHAHDYPITKIYGKDHHFSLLWFYTYPWIEYSVEKDAAFCFKCYLFGKENGTFVTGGWRNWNVGTVALTKHGNSKGHQFAQEKLNLFVQKDTKIDTVIVKVSEKEKLEYKARLTKVIRVLN